MRPRKRAIALLGGHSVLAAIAEGVRGAGGPRGPRPETRHQVPVAADHGVHMVNTNVGPSGQPLPCVIEPVSSAHHKDVQGFRDAAGKEDRHANPHRSGPEPGPIRAGPPQNTA